MTQKELRHMSRLELIELIAAQKRRELELEQQVKKLRQQLEDRTIRLSRAGSISEAALSLNGVFEAAQSSADAYLHSVREAAADAEQYLVQTRDECQRMLEEADREAKTRIAEAEQRCAQLLAETEQQSREKQTQAPSGEQLTDSEWESLLEDLLKPQ